MDRDQVVTRRSNNSGTGRWRQRLFTLRRTCSASKEKFYAQTSQEHDLPLIRQWRREYGAVLCRNFPNASVGALFRAPGDDPAGKKGDGLTVEFTVLGIACIGLNGRPGIKHREAFSFQVATTDQAETDRYWNAIVGNGGHESMCGGCKDKWGVSWQITSLALTNAIVDPDPGAAKRACDAMMPMRKIDIATIDAARRG